jgi:hypothetical protein
MENGAEAHPAKAGELGKFRQLVELQSQLVEQARKNELAEQRRDALWRELERTVQPPGRHATIAAFTHRLGGLRARLMGALRNRARPNGTRH